MLRMPAFQVHHPQSVSDALALKQSLPQSLYIAGGTDLLPNLKHGLHRPEHLISLSTIVDLCGIHPRESGWRIGANSTLQSLLDNNQISGDFPGLYQAAASIAGPHHRRMGTVGGNIMLDTRCLFYNQSESWRQALGFCLKKDGDWCHVVGSKATCIAAQSSDLVPMLIALNARIIAIDAGHNRHEIALDDLFDQDGRYEQVHRLPDSALILDITIPTPTIGHRSLYRKVRTRQAIDFPQLGIALSAAFSGQTCTELRVVVGAVLPKPKLLRGMDVAVGTALEDSMIEQLTEEAYKQVRPQRNQHGDPGWRRHMARVEMKRALLALRASVN